MDAIAQYLPLEMLNRLRQLDVLPAAGASLALYAVWKVVQVLYEMYTSPLRFIPGPKSPFWWAGNMIQIYSEAEDSVLQESWTKEYGPMITYKGFFGTNQVYTTDAKAINHVLTNWLTYGKPVEDKLFLERMLGLQGVLVAEGDQHRVQRKVMNPAFGPAQIRDITPVFLEKSIQMRDIWASLVAESSEDGVARIDVLSWLSRMTLDVIGIAGFNYEFNTLSESESPTELNQAFSSMFDATMGTSGFDLYKNFIPVLSRINTARDRVIDQAKAAMDRIGAELLRDSKAAVLEDEKMGNTSNSRSRDLLSLLVKSNTSPSLQANQRLSDEAVLSQIPTYLVAGHETTSTATTWALFSLSQHPEIQHKLREEVTTLSSDMPTMDELNSLTYLDYVVRETMRVHSPLPAISRKALKDDFIPVDTPFPDLNGRLQEGIHIRKGEVVVIPILAMNRSKDVWGADAMEFKPERWEAVPEAVGKLPGISGGMSFSGGPRACIGYRFALVEMKALLVTLVRAFEFELALPGEDIGKKCLIVQRPYVKSDVDAGHQMPMLVKRVQTA